MAYKYCLELFASHCAKRFIQDVKREDLLVSQLLKANGITKLLHNRDRPEYGKRGLTTVWTSCE